MGEGRDRKSTRLNSSHLVISYAVFCLKKKMPPVIASQRAYDRMVSLCEECGFHPQVVQEAPQWLTIMRLVGSGIGVTVAPACVQRIATPDVVCRKVQRTRTRSDIELAYRVGEDRAIVKTFCALAKSLLSGNVNRTSLA